MKYHMKREVSPQGIADLFITALEGGSSYWCESIDSEYDLKEASTWAALTTCRVEWTDMEDPEANGVKIVEAIDIERGLARIANWRYTVVDGDGGVEHDADSADAFFQVVLLGDVIYG